MREVEDLMSQLFFEKSKAKKPKTTVKAPTAADLYDRFGDIQRTMPYGRAQKTTSSPKTPKTTTSQDESLSPKLLDELYQLKVSGSTPSKPSTKLLELKYVTERETGPGGTVTIYSISQKGKDVLKAYGR